MLQELSHMDRITQLQDEIQQPRSPVTKQRNPEKFDPPAVFEANQRELVTDLIVKAKQIEYLINSLPEPEPEEEQAKRLQHLEDEMQVANAEYIRAVHRAKDLHTQISDVLRMMLVETDVDLPETAPAKAEA
ncbi:hypothetical protein BJ912DRAFT_1023926 [Pholiota molesta]|nr:hypothetical protein BJ912DRAFT_1023926 [Pholiota molesta]